MAGEGVALPRYGALERQFVGCDRFRAFRMLFTLSLSVTIFITTAMVSTFSWDELKLFLLDLGWQVVLKPEISALTCSKHNNHNKMWLNPNVSYNSLNNEHTKKHTGDLH